MKVSVQDLRWYWLGLQIPLLVLAMHFAPRLVAAVNAPVTAGVDAALCQAFPTAKPCLPKAKPHV